MRRLTLSVLSLAMLAACQPATTELTEEQKAEIETTVKQIATENWRAWLAQEDVNQVMSVNSDWAGTPWDGTSSPQELRASLLSHWENWDYQQDVDIEWDVMVLAPNVVAARAMTDYIRNGLDPIWWTRS